MSTIPSRSRTLRQRTTGNPLDPNDGTASLIKPGELVDVVEMTPLTLVDRRTYNLLLALPGTGSTRTSSTPSRRRCCAARTKAMNACPTRSGG